MMRKNCLLFSQAKSAFQFHRSSLFLRNISSGFFVCNSQVKECSTQISNHYEKSSAFNLENPKGLQDCGPDQLRRKNLIIQKIVNRFKSHGAECIDTPLFELRHILAGKYGRGCKPVRLIDEGGILSMRYDLTVPFARYLDMNKIKCFKRYQVGKVYRLKCPNVTTSMKEFTQCDFDIAGLYNPMLSDVECVQLLKEVFEDLEAGDHMIKVNHRQILYGILDICGVPREKFTSVCSSIHKYNKVAWEEMKQEIIHVHSLNEEVVDRIIEFMKRKGGRDLVEDLLQVEKLSQNILARQGLEEMKLFFKYCEWLDIDRVCFDLNLAGAYEYYTGLVFKGVLKDRGGDNCTEPNIWIAGGGRYDNLVGTFNSKRNSIPCVGVSFMIENMLSILENDLEVWNQSTTAGNPYCIASGSILGPCVAEESDEFTAEDSGQLINVPKGTKDFKPLQMTIREEMFKKIITCFEKHGFEPIDSPLFEIKDYLYGNHEESNKLIFDMQTDGIPMSMRYDLTVPFARYIAMNDLKHMKRYQIGHVGRRDSPSLVSGRYRLFHQCDIDIAGDYGPMVADVDCMFVLNEVLNNLGVGEYVIKINHRKILDGVLQVCGIPAEKAHPVISSVDKLDKLPWGEVRAEMIHERHLDPSVVDHIGTYIQKKGGRQLLEELYQSEELSQNESVKQGLKDMQLFFTYCDKSDLCKKVTWDLSLARGFDYYTGIIFEAVLSDLVGSEGERINVGSIAGGGRYDNLIGMFTSGNRSVPCVGMSLGIERIFLILEAKYKASGKKIRTNETEVLVTTPQRHHAEQRTRMCLKLWKSGIKTELQYKLNPKLLDQLQYCEARGIPWAVVFGQKELEAGTVLLRNVETREELEIPEQHLIEELKKRSDTKPN